MRANAVESIEVSNYCQEGGRERERDESIACVCVCVCVAGRSFLARERDREKRHLRAFFTGAHDQLCSRGIAWGHYGRGPPSAGVFFDV
jgi:hypothetical protein